MVLSRFYLYLTSVVGVFVVSCNSSEKQEANKDTQSHRSHPSDWKPEDPLLAKGRVVYMAECALCHDEGEDGAPPLARMEEWKTRAAKGEEVLFDHAINGFSGDDGKMPARGGTDTLTDEEVQNAVRYMVAASTKEH